MKLSTNSRFYKRKNAWWMAFFLTWAALSGKAQSLFSIELTKPYPYESRTLASEKSTSTNFGATKRFYTNTVSRFNYYFNANNKLNDLIEQKKENHIDDFTKLLPFYNYEFDADSKDLMDTVIYKCTAGILLHDLRSDWVDKLFLLLGKAYLYRKDFDSATTVFQYINYAFSPKDNGYDIPIGSNASNTNGIFTIATRENQGLWKKMASFPPSRNESFMWQVRTYIEQEDLTAAATLLEMIRTDPNFPERLKSDFHEMNAYLLYKQKSYEGAAFHLTKALGNAKNNVEMARWEFLSAQLYELANKEDLAIQFFEQSIEHATDPLIEVYARLKMVSLATNNQENALQKNLDELLKMAKRDKYQSYRDIIYYAAAVLDLKRKNYSGAQNSLLKSIKYNENEPFQRQKSFLLLGDLNYARKAYSQSYSFYDSLQIGELAESDQKRVEERKPALKIITENETIIQTEDSLQKIASLPEEIRNEFLKKLYKKIMKEKGLKEAGLEIPTYGSNLPPSATASSLFANTAVSEFYFLNASQKGKGMVDFKAKWGNRPNIDNWRRQTAIDRSMSNTNSTVNDVNTIAKPKKEEEKGLTLDSLMGNIPLTEAQKNMSNQAIIKALLDNALTFQNQLDDFQSAIEMYEELARRFPESAEMEEILFNLAYCYKKTEQFDKSDSVTAQLKSSFAGGKLIAQMNTAIKEKKPDPAQQKYEDIYRMFIEGKFDQAKEAKIAADKEFGKNYWTPQLLYIESIYYIKQKEDSIAIDRLQNIANLFGNSALTEKAITMIDVLKRRNQIEFYLTNLSVEKPMEIISRNVDLNSTTPLETNKIKVDSLSSATKSLAFTSKDLVDVSNTNTISSAPFVKKDSLAKIPREIKAKEILHENTTKSFTNKMYSFNPSDTQYAVVILDNVDPIFVSEGRNAFNRFNQDRFSDTKIEINNKKINGRYQFLLMGPFKNATDAISYIDKTKPVAGSRIVPWLSAEKFSFTIISNANINVLLNTQDVESYRTFMHEVFPDKF